MNSLMSALNQSTGKLYLLFIRHGETQDNIDRILQGHRDTDLTEKGVREAKVLADKIKDQQLDAIYHSPLKRMIQTIEPILGTRPAVPVIADADLLGQGLGELEGGSYDTIDMGNPRSADSQPGVEKFNSFVQRLKACLARIVGNEAPKVGTENRFVGIATHGVAITSIFKCLENTPQCEGFNPKIAVRDPEVYEVRWTDSDDVARLVIPRPADLPIHSGILDMDLIQGQPFVIEYWGKKEKAL